MRMETTPALATKLVTVSRAFESWRRTRSGRSRIPAPLWALAVDVARECGVHPTARRLHLDYYSLKQRVAGASDAATIDARPAPPAFIEVLPPGGRSTAISECVIDLADGRGATLRIAVKSAALPDLAALSQALWRARA